MKLYKTKEQLEENAENKKKKNKEKELWDKNSEVVELNRKKSDEQKI